MHECLFVFCVSTFPSGPNHMSSSPKFPHHEFGNFKKADHSKFSVVSLHGFLSGSGSFCGTVFSYTCMTLLLPGGKA